MDAKRFLEAAQMGDMYAAARAYLSAGVSVLPLRGKQPAIWWKHLQGRRTDERGLAAWYQAGLLQNVGVICGAVSGLAVLDLDGEEAVRAFRYAFPRPWTLTIQTGRGLHLYFAASVTTQRILREGYGFELRAEGCYVVAPPSVHPSGARYVVINALPPSEQVAPVLGWLAQQRQRAQRREEASERPVYTARDYGAAARAALAKECERVRTAPVGQRNTTLYLAAYNLGQLVGDGYLTSHSVYEALMEGTQHNGLPAAEAERTIRSGLARGIAEPRSQQWQKRKK